MQVSLMLEEIEVAPGLLFSVVRRAGGATAWAGEPAAGGEVDVDVETLGRRIEVALLTVHGGVTFSASCIRLVSRMALAPLSPRSAAKVAPCSPPSRMLRAALHAVAFGHP